MAVAGTGYVVKQQPGHEAIAHAGPHAHHEHTAASTDKPAPRKIWACPMHAHIMQDHPGSCPICGMDLVLTDSHAQGEDLSVSISPDRQQLLSVRKAALETKALVREIRTFGYIGTDESTILNVAPKIEGWIRKLHVRSTGQHVAAGQLLYEIYSPELVQRQREYIELLQRRDKLQQSMADMTGQNAQMAASLARERIRTREKFQYVDLDASTLEAIEKYRRPVDIIPIYAAKSGYVTQIGAREGSYVTPLLSVVSMTETSRIWVDITLYPDQLAWVREGNEVSLSVSGLQGDPLTGRLSFINKVADARTLKARVMVNKPTRWLPPGLPVEATIHADAQEVLAVPRSAVIRTGDGNHVMLARSEGRFMPVPVETGIENGEYVEIVDGLAEGAEVAMSGQFLLDASASLNEAAQRMQGHD